MWPILIVYEQTVTHKKRKMLWKVQTTQTHGGETAVANSGRTLAHTPLSTYVLHPHCANSKLTTPQTHLTSAERALYAALAPSPQTSIQLKAACHTWEDHLWAQISVVCEEKESAEMSRLVASFWEGRPGGIGGGGEENMNMVRDEEEEGEEEEWEKEVVGALESLANIVVDEGCVLCFILSEREFM